MGYAACAAALATLEAVTAGNLCKRAALRGERLLHGLRSLAKRFPTTVTGVSGRGLLAALHTTDFKTCTEIVKHCIRKGVLVMTAFCDKTRILIEPPFCITTEQLDTALGVIGDAVEQVSATRFHDTSPIRRNQKRGQQVKRRVQSWPQTQQLTASRSPSPSRA